MACLTDGYIGPVAFFSGGLVLGFLIGRLRSARAQRQAGAGGNGAGVELYVGNLPYDVDTDRLAKAFTGFGTVLSARVISNRVNGKSRGYGFVVMADQKSADAAIKGMHGAEMDGRRIIVSEARTRPGGRRRSDA